MSLISVFEKLSEEDKAILARHQSRVSGFISMETLAEYFPNIDVQTSLRILETLLRSQHVKTGKHGCYTFVDPTGEIESGDLEEELRVLADFKRNLPDQILTSSSSNILENHVREDTLGERAPSGEECIVLRRENYLGVDGKDILETPLGRKVSGRKGSYDALMSHQRPSRADPSRKWSLEGTSFDARSLKSFKQSTPVVGNFGNPMSSPEHVTRRRRSSEERSPSFNMSEERNSCGTMRNPPPELNETIRFEVDSPDTSFATPLNDEAGSNPAILPGPADATLEVEPSMFTNDGYDSTSSELASRFRALEFASSEDVSPAESREELSDLSRVEDTPTETNPLTATNVSKSREAPLELNTASSEPIPSSVHNQAEMAIEEAERAPTVEVPLESIEAHDRTEPTAAAPQESDQIHLRKEEVEDHVEDPCRALEVFCQCMNLKPPAYNLTYMPMQEVFYCLLFVGNKSFPSFPTESVTEEGARKVAAEKAVKILGITAGMVATRFENLMINPKWGIRDERPVSKSQVPQTEP